MTVFDKINHKLCVAAFKKEPRIKEYKPKITAEVQSSGVIKQGFTFLYPTYKKYIYCDKNTGEGYFFRYKPIKEKGEYPVVIYHHGNGLNRAGKNDVQLVEFSKLIKKLNKHKCHQIAVHLDVSCEYNREAYSRALDGIVRFIKQTYNNVDFDRIYLTGTSHGGYACVYEVLRNPERYAAAVISMSYTYNEKFAPPDEIQENPYVRILTDDDYEALSKTPFYLSWAKDDCELMVVSNNLLSEKLKKNNGDVKIKVYENGGHTIAGDFFKNGDWDEWLFSKER